MERLAVDIGASKVAVRQLTSPSDLNGSVGLPRYPDPGKELFEVLETCCRQNWIIGSQELVIISSAAETDNRGVVTNWPNRPHWIGFDLKGFMQSQFKCECIIIEDGLSACFADCLHFNSDELASLVFGTGIGGAVYKKGRYFQSIGSSVGLGHFSVGRTDFQKCVCGLEDCAQAYCSVGGIISRGGQLSSKWSTIQEFNNFVESGERDASRVLHNAVLAACTLIREIHLSFGTTVFSLSGGLIEAIPKLFGAIYCNMESENASVEGVIKIRRSGFPNASLAGVAYLCQHWELGRVGDEKDMYFSGVNCPTWN